MNDLEKDDNVVGQECSTSIVPASPQSTLQTVCSTWPLTTTQKQDSGQAITLRVLRRLLAFLRWSRIGSKSRSDRAEAEHDPVSHEDVSQDEEASSEGSESSPAQTKSTKDVIVRTLERFPRGYPNLAAFADSHENFMLYRRFGYLQARVLLEKQDELRELEEQLDALDEEDKYDDVGKLYRRHQQGEQRKLLLGKVEDKFCDYARVIGAAQQLMSFNKPTKSEHRSGMNYIHNNRPVEDKESAYMRCKEDLITLRPGREFAWLDALIEKLLRWFHCDLIEFMFCSKESKMKTTDPKNIYYCQQRIAGCALGILMLVILFLLVVPTYTLFNLVNSELEGGQISQRVNALCIGILLIFTLLFSAALSLFTGAKRHEILGAAAAYCAVLVVFLGNVGNAVAK